MARRKTRHGVKRATPPDTLGPEAGPTFGELLARLGLVDKVGGVTRDLIARCNAAAAEHARARLTVVSCFECTEPKACCSLITGIHLYEAVPIAARLIGEGRDTPELRERLRAAAHRMETTRKADYQQPCVFLDGDQRCTVYQDRPSVCGTHLVSSPAAACSDPAVASVVKLVTPLQDQVPPELDARFTMDTGLRPLDVPYRGTLPRMVLLCLEAWPRRDYVTFLAERALPAYHRYAWAAAT